MSSSPPHPQFTTTTMPLFPSSLLPPAPSLELPEGYTIRPLERTDYAAGFLDVLRVLTKVGEISETAWTERYDWMSQRSEEYFVICVVNGSGTIVGVGSLVVERKFLRNLAKCGHIEDIAVLSSEQGKKLGLRIIQTLDHIAQQVGCYKAILDCSEKNQPFYEKCGYTLAGIQMARYYDDSKPKDAPVKKEA
ncbi:acyl-CoA N-acyltransferase [Wilcoxina mikolae CBS 423.85]|nr:acyl-CoA N-acyltransferase [Wilcoxina mikolae CBS 423.85]